MLRTASDADVAFLNGLSPVGSVELLREQIREWRLLIIEHAGEPAGFIKFYVLWETLPFIEVIVVREDLRMRGIGKAAVRFWEREMAKRSHSRVLVSTQSNESAQDFWRRIGYRDCGSLELPGRPGELFMYRDTGAPEAPFAEGHRVPSASPGVAAEDGPAELSDVGEPNLSIRPIGEGDSASMSRAFLAIGWRSKPLELFERYRREQDRGEREVLVVFVGAEFAGYITVKWKPTYKPLAAAGIPELQDLNVLPLFRRKGVATRLVAAAESLVRRHSDRVGIAVGLHPGYNAAQRLYAVLGYVPDGNGVTVRERSVSEGDTVVLDDDFVLHLEKRLAIAAAG
jgi:GNAT superfamily N-acetyltransferase